MHFSEVLLQSAPGGTDLGAQVTDEDRRRPGLVSRPHVDPVILLRAELGLASFLRAFADPIWI